MTIEIDVSPELEADLLAQAQRRGMSLEAYAENLLTDYVREMSMTAPVTIPPREEA